MSLLRVPVSSSFPSRRRHVEDNAFLRAPGGERRHLWQQKGGRGNMVVVAKGNRLIPRELKKQKPPPLPKLEDDGNPNFIIFIRSSNVYFWYPLTIVSGGTTAKLMVAAKDNFLGKYIYKDTLDRNIAAVIYKDEKEILDNARKKFRVLQSATSFRYGYKIVANNNLRAALSTSGVVELPKQEELKTVVDKVKDFVGDATNNVKESFGKLTFLNTSNEQSETKSKRGR